MTSVSFVAAMLAGRTLLKSHNPELSSWCRRQWARWLQTQRGAQLDISKSQLTVVAHLTCLTDVRLHVGLMQLLGESELRCAVIFCLPTEETADIARAQARREEWHQLVLIVSEDEWAVLLANLPAFAVLAVFRMPAALSEEARRRIASLCGVSIAAVAGAELREGPGFVGTAGDLGATAQMDLAIAQERVFDALRAIVSLHAPNKKTGTPAPRAPRAGGPIEDFENIDGGSIYPTTGVLELPQIGQGDELTLVALDDHSGPKVIARHIGELNEPNRPFRIKVPASYLTTEPQMVRLECRYGDGRALGADLQLHVPPSRLQPWMISAFLNRGGGGNPLMRAFAQGVGCRIAYAEDEPTLLREVPVVWGVLRDSDRILDQAKAQGLYYFYIDHAYFNRGHGKTYRITRNRYEAGPVRDCPSDRIEAQGVEVLPWRKSGREIIVCPPTDYFAKAHGCSDWLDKTLAMLGRLTDRPIRVRQKPKPGEEAVPLPKALETAHALVTHSSNVAIEAACLGTPVFVSPASAAAPIGCTDLAEIEAPVYPDRTQWLAHLAYNQFSFDEISDGRAWQLLLELEERELV